MITTTLTPNQLRQARIAAELRARGTTWERIAELLGRRIAHLKRQVDYIRQQETNHGW